MDSLEHSLESFFYEHIDRACRTEGVTADPGTGHYLVVLLAGYAAHPIDDKPLALRMLQSVDLEPRQRRTELRNIGDTSLYVSGFWSESLARSVVDVDYYIGMGESAYGELARTTPKGADPFADVFGNLAVNFPRFVRVLSAISETLSGDTNPQDVLKLYDRWKRTGSSWAKRRLARLGVTLDEGTAKKVH